MTSTPSISVVKLMRWAAWPSIVSSSGLVPDGFQSTWPSVARGRAFGLSWLASLAAKWYSTLLFDSEWSGLYGFSGSSLSGSGTNSKTLSVGFPLFSSVALNLFSAPRCGRSRPPSVKDNAQMELRVLFLAAQRDSRARLRRRLLGVGPLAHTVEIPESEIDRLRRFRLRRRFAGASVPRTGRRVQTEGERNASSLQSDPPASAASPGRATFPGKTTRLGGRASKQ